MLGIDVQELITVFLKFVGNFFICVVRGHLSLLYTAENETVQRSERGRSKCKTRRKMEPNSGHIALYFLALENCLVASLKEKSHLYICFLIECLRGHYRLPVLSVHYFFVGTLLKYQLHWILELGMIFFKGNKGRLLPEILFLPAFRCEILNFVCSDATPVRHESCAGSCVLEASSLVTFTLCARLISALCANLSA